MLIFYDRIWWSFQNQSSMGSYVLKATFARDLMPKCCWTQMVLGPARHGMWGSVMSYLTLFKIGFWSHHDRWSPSSIIVIGRIRAHEHADVHEKNVHVNCIPLPRPRMHCAWPYSSSIQRFLQIGESFAFLTLDPSRDFSEKLLLPYSSSIQRLLQIGETFTSLSETILRPSQICKPFRTGG